VNIVRYRNIISIDVEDWFHILDSPAVPHIEQWDALESRVANNLERLLDLLDRTQVKATLFWLGWVAQRHPKLLRKCISAGHEIASHGYGHVLAYEVGPKAYMEDISLAKTILEETTGVAVNGFRAPGFGITNKAVWAFDVIREAGYRYDSSIFPAARGHGGLLGSRLGPHIIDTSCGPLYEIPQSMLTFMGKRFSLFGGGYLRLAPLWMIRRGVRALAANGQPLLIYIHPREIDPDHPRLPLSPIRRFKCYHNLHSTFPKLNALCESGSFVRMGDYVNSYFEPEEAITSNPVA
jgi:polysaccharide deacetylase family protein (PEP-CTERM system associated)